LGYRVSEVPSKIVPASTTGTKIEAKLYPVQKNRTYCARSLGCHVEGFANPAVDTNDPSTVVHGIQCRFVAAPPPVSRKALLPLKNFVAMMLRKYLKPLGPDVDLSYDNWLNHTHYSNERRGQLRRNWTEGSLHLPSARECKCKSFIKTESYPTYKAARAINARTDYFKNFSGPYFKAIENEVFKLPFFVKHIPINQRAAYIKSRIHAAGANYYCTDFSSFESLFTPDILHAIEFQLYEYMLPNHRNVVCFIKKVLGGINQCRFRNHKVSIPGKRMTGEMATSLGNGFTNWILCSYLCHCHESECVGVFEGDDGIFRVNGDYVPSIADFEKLGWRIKIDTVRDFSEASFCGLIADEVDLQTITDPVRALLNFGWTSSTMMNSKPGKLLGLLRSKALSLKAEYPACPMLTALADRFIYLTQGTKAYYDNNSWYGRMKRARDHHEFKNIESSSKISIPITDRTRNLFERKFHVSRAQQLEMEAYFATLELNMPLKHPTLRLIIDSDVADFRNIHRADYFHRYVCELPRGSLHDLE